MIANEFIKMLRKTTIKDFYGVLFLLLLIVLGGSSVILFFKNNVVLTTTEVQETEEIATINFEELYPFAETEESNSSSDEQVECLLETYYTSVAEVTDKTNTYLTTMNPWRKQFQGIQQLLNEFHGDIYFDGSNAILKLQNGYLIECCEYCLSNDAEDSILDFAAWLEERDTLYITLITPDKSDDSTKEYPKQGVPHGYSQMLDDYKMLLDVNGLYYIDAKKTLLSEQEDLYSWFYKTDHHWNVQAAFALAKETANILNNEFDITTDTSILDDENFTLEVYPDSFLGSYASFFANTEKENMEVLYPTEATDFHIEIPSYGMDVTGSFETTLIDQSQLGEEESFYSAFLYGDSPLVEIENNTCENGTRILVIKYSFADSLCPYLATTVQYLDMIDPRYFDGSIRSYIEQTNPDAVILCMGVVMGSDEEYLQLK